MEEGEGNVEIKIKQMYAPIVLEWKILIEAKYIVASNGEIEMMYRGVPVGNQLPETFPRIGLRFCWTKRVKCALVRTGPWGNRMWTRKRGIVLAVFESTVVQTFISLM